MGFHIFQRAPALVILRAEGDALLKMRRQVWLWLIVALSLMVAVGCGDDGGSDGGGGDQQTPDEPDDDDMDPDDGNNDVEPPQVEYCGQEFPEGVCPQGQQCLDGACVDLGLICSQAQPNGLCEHGGRCVDGLCWGPDEVCSAQTPIGVCSVGLFCNQGVCTDRTDCAPASPNGACAPGEACFDGACRPASELCSLDNTEGECQAGMICLEGSCVPEGFLCGPDVRAGRCESGQTCSGGECMGIAEACGLGNPGGSCGGGFQCLEGACRNPDELCSPGNPFGFCAQGLSCVDGQCVEQTLTCSPEIFDGLCPEGMECSAGHCHGEVACDNVFVFGGCQQGSTCMCGSGPSPAVSCSDSYAPDDASAAQVQAIERTNELRNAIGLWSIAQNSQINVAATAHADYLVNEANEAHDETRTQSPWFTGAKFWDRMEAAGYAGSPFSEVIAYIGDPVRAVDELIATVYHREPFFDPIALEMGYGGSTGANGSADVINFGRAEFLCREDVLVVFPPHNAANVPVSWDGRESPQPPPPPGGYPSGPIISVHGSSTLVIEEHRILLGDSELEHTHLTADNDPHGAVGQGTYFLYPHTPLRAQTEYTVVVSGRHGGKPFRLQWSFTTGQ